MAATPKTGVVEFTGRSGQKYVYSIYNSDVAAGFVTWNRMGAAGTGSVDFISAPEDMQLTDISTVTGIVDTTALLLFLDDGAIAGKLISWANVVNTLQHRSFPNIGIRAGRKVQFQEVA
jgi:hypothetical protein